MYFIWGVFHARIVFALLLEKRYGTSQKTIPLQQVGIGCKQKRLVSLCVLLEHVFGRDLQLGPSSARVAGQGDQKGTSHLEHQLACDKTRVAKTSCA